jgi:predicted AAA+ superfamily ATPase
MIKRILFNELKSHLSKREISLIVGPRQSGKTTLMLLLKDFLIKNGERVIFLNLDVEADRNYFLSQSKLISKIQLEIGKNKGFVFIDEIQRKEDAGLFLKGIYDLNLPYKFIVSGSGSIELKEKIHESLVGRKRIFELTTLTFEEFVNFKTGYKYENSLNEFFEVENDKVKEIFQEYLYFGGYPRIALAESISEKQLEMNEIYQSYLEKDISFLLNIQKTEEISNLVKILASQIGKLTNFSELSNTLRLSNQTLRKYLWYLEKTFIINKITPFFKNVRKEITKSPVYYFYDLGLRNYSLGLFRRFGEIYDIGFIFQNFIFNILRDTLKTSSVAINFWRTLDKAEVDFVISPGIEIFPIEVKYKFLKNPVIGRSLRNFIAKYNPKKAFVVNFNYESTIKINNTEVFFLTYRKVTNFFNLLQ